MPAPSAQVFFFGGNGHAAIRLDGARQAIHDTGLDLELLDVPYPGFEARPSATSWAAFLDALVEFVRQHQRAPKAWIMATGIGGLIALTLRAHGRLLDVPLIIQGPVLWGLEHRFFPKALRNLPPLRAVVRWLLKQRWFQQRFVRKHLQRVPDEALVQGFFAGYEACAAFEDFFAWLTPSLLRELEQAFAEHPDRLSDILVWWGDHDTVVTLRELEQTQAALDTVWPLRRFADWGHYPMLDQPQEWVQALAHEMATSHAFSTP